MKLPGEVLSGILSSWKGDSPSAARRRTRKLVLSCSPLEDRVTPSGFAHPASAVASAHVGGRHSGGTTESAALIAAELALKTDLSKILSGTTVGQLTTLNNAFKTLKTDGLTPLSRTALASFEDSLVTAAASGTALASTTTTGAALLTQFEALYTTTPATLTATQTADLTAAYDALAAAVTSAGITTANITTINADYAAVLAAGGRGGATFPLFSLVTGQGSGGHGGGCH